MTPRTRKILTYGGAAVAGVVGYGLVFGSRFRPKNPIEAVQGFPLVGFKNTAAYYAKLTSEVGWGASAKTKPTPSAEAVWAMQQLEFQKRMGSVMRYLGTLSPDAAKKAFGNLLAPSEASKQSFLLYRPGHGVAGAQVGLAQPWGWYFTDEFGRPFEGWGYGGSALGGVLPIVQYALPLIPGLGTAGGAALGAAIAIGQGKSYKDIGIAAARGALPPYATMAFDAGVAIASGHSLSEAAQAAALTALEERYPGSRQAFADGKSVYAGVK